jgi:hypothetical protein
MLSHLPEELLDRIALLTPHRSTLHALCLTSRDLNRIATPHLYHSIFLQKDDFKHLRPLALLLWTSPKHSDVVHAISVKGAYGGNLMRWPQYEGLEALLKKQIGLYVKEGDEGSWYEQVGSGIDALPIASLLLRSLPNVSVMQFDGFMLVDPKVKRRVIGADDGIR